MPDHRLIPPWNIAHELVACLPGAFVGEPQRLDPVLGIDWPAPGEVVSARGAALPLRADL